MTVEKRFLEVCLLNFIKTFTLERERMDAAIVIKFSDRSYPSFFTRELTIRKKATNVISVGKVLIES